MKKKLPDVCFLGCGEIAAKHTKILKKLYPDLKISFASRSITKSREYKDRFKGSHSFNSYEEALTSDKFEIAFITTPNDSHSELAVLAANNNKDIIIEKPIARNLKEFSEIEKAVDKNGVRCVVAENYYYKPFITKVRRHIETGQIGDLILIELNKTNREDISGWRTNSEIMGGGALLEGGVHWVNCLVSLAGYSPIEVIAFKPETEYKTNIPYEDTLMLMVKFSNGAVGKLLHSWRIPNPLKGISLSKIYGTEGVITFESNGLFVSLHGKKKRFFITNPFNFLGFKAMHKSFIESYIEEKPWQPSLEIIKNEMTLVHAAYKSLSSKKVEKIS